MVGVTSQSFEKRREPFNMIKTHDPNMKITCAQNNQHGMGWI
jgi:hypothetical protein